jgi:aspartyl-tRNA(Asn)/glutamyl-tRNA(Gln) amidotransferase subunit B
MAAMFGLAIGAEIARRSVFARKNYFYPDLPKGYQISQYELPIVQKGQLIIDLEEGVSKVIGITRAHLEEDAGKSLHEDFQGLSGSTSTGPGRRCWKSFPSRICARPRRRWPT